MGLGYGLERCCIFFFQAEDGIRDRLVTGVQTCALPILPEAMEWVVNSLATSSMILTTSGGNFPRVFKFMVDRKSVV